MVIHALISFKDRKLTAISYFFCYQFPNFWGQIREFPPHSYSGYIINFPEKKCNNLSIEILGVKESV